jgi:arylsulfatase A-like enzyme
LGGDDYFNWERLDDGVATQSTEYNTLAIADATINWYTSKTRPWFAYVAFHAPHSPYHMPPASLLGGHVVPSNPTNRDLYEASIVALDTVIGLMLNSLPDNTIVIFVGDNGTPKTAVHPLQDPDKVKGNVFREGIEVPCVVWGLGNGDFDGIAQTSDLFATIIDIANKKCVNVIPDDSVSLFNQLQDPTLLSDRDLAYSEKSNPNGATNPISVFRAVTGDVYKYCVVSNPNGSMSELFFNLDTDQWENMNLLLGPLTPTETNILNSMQTFMAQSIIPL